MVLAGAVHDDEAQREFALRAGANWVIGMQSKDGGFAAFDPDNNSQWLNHVPFADVEASTDPACADLTGRVLEMMAEVGYTADHPVARRAIAWLKRDQKRRRFMVGAMGCLLHLRHFLGTVRLACDWCHRQRTLDPARGSMAQISSKS